MVKTSKLSAKYPPNKKAENWKPKNYYYLIEDIGLSPNTRHPRSPKFKRQQRYNELMENFSKEEEREEARVYEAEKRQAARQSLSEISSYPDDLQLFSSNKGGKRKTRKVRKHNKSKSRKQNRK